MSKEVVGAHKEILGAHEPLNPPLHAMWSFMLILLNPLCTNTGYTQNKRLIRNHTFYIVDSSQPKKRFFLCKITVSHLISFKITI